MYDIHDAPVFQATFDLLKEFHIIRNKFPKTEKYSLGEKIEESLLAIIIAIIEAGRSKKEMKLPPIERALSQKDKAQVLFRLAFEIRVVSDKQYETSIEQLQKIGRMLGAWRNSI
ncbi:TPA: hypothetical protein DCZ32_03150 [Candidatus Uhrbacteria bacterium]|nr:hypothetical protein [Candidatus Uhrbacteria bacterium]